MSSKRDKKDNLNSDNTAPESSADPSCEEKVAFPKSVIAQDEASENVPEEVTIRKKSSILKQSQSFLRRRQIDEYKMLVLKEERKLRYLKRHGDFTDDEDEFKNSPSSSPKKKVSFESDKAGTKYMSNAHKPSTKSTVDEQAEEKVNEKETA
ncbi:hypothetical protein CLIB1423_04S03642 [[Candida] railenensis]|uniref:Uncharacterized protein n=1 Tax=[Candida] railenensis TaxID=45579 RepID=A0A9P0QNG6_9ASCO|nr:hypothetical protein CLIB1423_04S03642 [[Candida] railenensis]